MSARWLTFLLWALVAASVVAWSLKLFVTAPPAPSDARVADATRALRGDVMRVLGVDAVPVATEGEPKAPANDARFQLVGVVAPRSAQAAREGVALIAVDGKPPRAYRVGARIDQDTVLKSVRARGADLGPRDGAPTIALEIAPPPAAATGTLPAAGVPSPAAPQPPARLPGRPGVAGQLPGPPAPGVPPPAPLPNLQVPAVPGVPAPAGMPSGTAAQEGLSRS